MTLDEKNGVLEFEMRRCPSRGMLNELERIEPYEHYCEHCDTLCRRVLEPLGFEYSIDLSAREEARCRGFIKARPVD